MFATHAFAALLALATPFFALADVTPSEPGPGDIFNAGTTCHTTWLGDTDSTTIWKNMAIELMSGSNLGMVHITTVATGQDGTKDGRFEYPCPEVDPYSAIYFYQYSSQTSVKTWTTRFTIASAAGATTPPANPTQPGSNDPIPWGIGNLVDTSKAVPAPGAPGGNISSSVSVPAPSAPSSSPSSRLPTSTPSRIVTNIVTSSSDSARATSTSTPAGSGALPLGLDSRVGLSAAALIFAALMW